ncbi:hypothetical protein ACFX2C_008993 [Malus domestica]
MRLRLSSCMQNAKKAPNVSLGETVQSRLKQFSVMNKLKKSTLKVIAEHLSMEEVGGIQEGFKLMDINKGKINIDELRVGLHKLGHQIPDGDLHILMEAGDVDNDGYLDYGEFVAISIHLRMMGNDEEHLHKAFEFFDKNRNGYIEIEELRDALSNEVDDNIKDVINAIINDVDTDKDGRISYEVFAAMMKARTDWRKASRQYSRDRFNSLSLKLFRDGSLEGKTEST